MSELPATIKIDDITSGRIEPEVIYAELERLKVEINILRHDMSIFVKALASIPDGQTQSAYYANVESKLRIVQKSITDYYSQYVRLLPIINLAQIKLGHEVEIQPVKQSSQESGNGGSAGKQVPAAARRSSGSKAKGTVTQPIEL
ncbi:hypothetical protein CLIB1423_24S00386 [[Candida] railenensis]|uniref:Uncharacterized protein n=1 Tax=[Candida] railenensis TaxID=45579 RepID=A0A9P0W0R1_9ASCO|nr:hypothetical protein CLIB1423_24S00386 [[Candida] railenensis]